VIDVTEERYKPSFKLTDQCIAGKIATASADVRNSSIEKIFFEQK
jgi:hypothetical protein